MSIKLPCFHVKAYSEPQLTKAVEKAYEIKHLVDTRRNDQLPKSQLGVYNIKLFTAVIYSKL